MAADNLGDVRICVQKVGGTQTANLLGILLLTIGLGGCDLARVPIDVEPAESRLVVSSIVGPGETMLVTVSRSFSALSAQDADSLSSDFVGRLLVDSANVLLRYEGQEDTLRSVFDTPGLYGGSFSGTIENSEFVLSIADPQTGQNVTASTELMPVATLGFAEYWTELDNGNDTTTVFSYRFEDLPGESFYVLHAYNLPDAISLDSLFSDGGDELNPLLASGGGLFYERLLLDTSFDGSEIADTVRVIDFLASESIVLSLSNVSEGYFRFLQARKRSGGILSSLSNEPVNHPTNVEGGYGFFSAHRPQPIIVERR